MMVSLFYPKMTFPFSLLLKFISILYMFTIIFSPSSSSKLSSSRSSRKAQYGSPCNSSVKCDIHSLLMCEENVCQCLYPDAMMYNTDLGTCVSQVNEICGYLETKRVFINCVPNSYCDQQQGVCKCTQGYVESDRNCIKQKGYGEPCHSDNECLSELSLTCFEEVCQCDPKRSAPYSLDHNLSGPQGIPSSKVTTKCVTLAGLPCTVRTGCVRMASCVSEAENDATVSSSTFLWMQSGICTCDAGYQTDKNNQCQGMYGSYCDVLANITCVQNFQCLNGICHCKFPDDQIFHEETGRCVSLAGGPCTAATTNENDDEERTNKEIITCDKFMECRNLTCSCKNGFVENLNRGCDLSYGQLCTGETMRRCDAAAGLHCVDGRCTCKDNRKDFDMKSGKCVGKTGSTCKMYPVVHRPVIKDVEIDDGKLSCSENMKCQASRVQLEGITSRGFCTPTEGGGEAHIPTPSLDAKEREGWNSVNRQEINDEEVDY